MASQKLLEYLNQGIARELQVSIQYMWQHVQVTTHRWCHRREHSPQNSHSRNETCRTPRRTRLDYLNGVATTKPDPIFVRGSLIEMLKQNEQDEEKAINLYKQAIQVAAEEGDYTTRTVAGRDFSGGRRPHTTRSANCSWA